MDLLCVLAAHRGQVVSREPLMQALGPAVVVGDDSLARTVSKLRPALGDDARSPTSLETIAKRGYRLLASDADGTPPVAQAPGRPPPDAWLALVGGLLVVATRVAFVLLRDATAAEAWYRRVLALSPLQPDAMRGLAGVLAEGGDAAAAERLCRELEQRLGQGGDCP